MRGRLRICLIASSRFPIREPLAGGLEAHTLLLARTLRQRGHEISLFAAPGSRHDLDVQDLPAAQFTSSAAARADVGAMPDSWMREHHAYMDLMLELARTGPLRFDVIHNNSLHHLPLAMASMVEVPTITTLHTPPLAWLESAMPYVPATARFAAVSSTMAAAWSHAVASTVVLNGVDTAQWRLGKGGGPDVWSGRIVPEKGTHLAVQAAIRSGRRLDLAGPIVDTAYFQAQVRPHLGERIRYLGHLPHRDLVDVVGRASVALVTPCWEEPYGLVAAEAMSTGTPVAAFARGALPEIVDDSSGRLADPGDVDGLAGAVRAAASLDRAAVRRRAVNAFSAERMVDEYERLYRSNPVSVLAS
ncbi:MAG: glycosyltransferase [Actinomycetota bacterium]|nr:glycosyltransferase [Actinomycetota bacterium]